MTKKIILQGVTPDSHLSAIKKLLSIENPELILISVAFLNQKGIHQIRNSLTLCASKVTVFAGIRNGITSAQGLSEVLKIGCSLYVVDTGSRSTVFHPKIYFSKSINKAQAIIGSANMTIGGLQANIEASVQMYLDLDNDSDKELSDDIQGKIQSLSTGYPDHVIRIKDESDVDGLFESGLVIDETVLTAPSAPGHSNSRESDSIPKMALHLKDVKRPQIKPQESLSKPHEQSANNKNTNTQKMLLVWQSKPLTERHLNIPTGLNTNPTGSMSLGKGTYTDIDQQHYFRDDVFKGLDWTYDTQPGKSHLERADANFKIIIKNVDYGRRVLKLTHNTRTDTTSYKQNNNMTALHWGAAKELVTKKDLLGRTLYLYRSNTERREFVLKID